MKMSLRQMIAIICILTVAFMTVSLFISEVDAHPHEFWYHIHDNHCAEWDGQYHTYCGGKRIVRIAWRAPKGHPGHSDDPNHEDHIQRWLPTVHTSSLERVDSCDKCTYS
ncbi:MAG: hypothetical protein OXU27_18525 [Candidatus Poribacteria bacterium]|nr:hypothetical protein [Candidatus Poribacteria bacterium]